MEVLKRQHYLGGVEARVGFAVEGQEVKERVTSTVVRATRVRRQPALT